MQFSELLSKSELAPHQVQGDCDVQTVVFDSRKAAPGVCFVAVKGWQMDGHDFIADAAARSCAAIICEDAANVPAGVPHVVVPDSHAALGKCAQAIRGWPTRKLTNIGITGTNGKSTTAWMIHQMLTSAGMQAAMLGTIAYETGARSVTACATTPDPVSLADMMAEMVGNGCTHLVMEVSSHALDQRRCEGVEFRAAVFTNLTGDHLDYHLNMDNYMLAKRKLFDSLGADATAIVNADDPYGRQMAAGVQGQILWYGLETDAGLTCDLGWSDREGSVGNVQYAGSSVEFASALPGRHNVLNCLAAIGVGVGLGIDLVTCVKGVSQVPSVPGRLQRVDVDAPYSVFVDYAHTDDALRNVLESMRAVVSGRLIVVFGCGGDRDRSKRPRMGAVAAELADSIVITSDNPRSEDPQAIIDEILAGIAPGDLCRCIVEPDRQKAITAACKLADKDDIVLLAGKGHESYQEVNGKRHDFDDAKVASEVVGRIRHT